MIAAVAPENLKEWLHDGAEIALLDVREAGQFGESHLFFAVPLPYSRLELDAPRLLPRLATRIVVYDDGILGVARPAAERLAAMGYSNVSVLEGGTRAWKDAGLKLFAGVNVPSKAFGELVEMRYHTPRITAQRLAKMLEGREDVVVLDGRPLGEYRKMTIPGSRCCPNGELAWRIGEIVRDESTPIVVNCAGRTRSIIGAQTLINFGVANPVYALENGTQGWFLADFALEHGAERRYPEVAESTDAQALRARAEALARRHGVRYVDDDEVARWLADASRTTYLCDVRTPDEFARGSLPGAVNAPGGQLVQATDQWVAVRHARIVLIDSEGVRAPVVASWLLQMGHDAVVLRDGIASRVAAPAAKAALPAVREITAKALASGNATVVELRPSMAYRDAHIPGSLWSIRPRLEEVRASIRGPVVLVADEPGVARIAAADLARAGVNDIAMLQGGFEAWRASGLPVEASPGEPPDARCIDYLFFVHDRHDGNKAAARQYLAWETQLLSQLDERELAAYRLPSEHAA
ncbi:MAG TPA: rhodanese-like domain-containing protein [Usitatibacter sp.]|jgi:rhodanese-related sulfurtransferase|nr:rhodanese-like domain-containing protein [Usitatibacter sp.]